MNSEKYSKQWRKSKPVSSLEQHHKSQEKELNSVLQFYVCELNLSSYMDYRGEKLSQSKQAMEVT